MYCRMWQLEWSSKKGQKKTPSFTSLFFFLSLQVYDIVVILAPLPVLLLVLHAIVFFINFFILNSLSYRFLTV